MAMDDEETVALIAGGHTFGKDAALLTSHVGSGPSVGEFEGAGSRLKSGFNTGMGVDAITSGLEVTWPSR